MGNRSTKAWPDRVSLWLAWTIVTTLGWALAGLLTLGMAFAFAIPDSDAARIHLSTPLRVRLFDGLFLGAIVGLVHRRVDAVGEELFWAGGRCLSCAGPW